MDLKLLSNIKLTEGQEKALQMVRKLVVTQGRDPVVGVLKGYAGTGKSTMLRVVSETVGDSTIVTPTGKAAVRVTEATGLPASTIHRWLYKPKRATRNGPVEWALKNAEELTRPKSGLVIIDEASMLDEQVWEHLHEACQTIQCNILLVGDAFQLPPVAKNRDRAEPFSVLGPAFKTDFECTLTEVLRQALESPIIRASMKLREGDWMSAIFDLPRVSSENLLAFADQIIADRGVVIVHKNESRFKVNAEIRRLRQYPEELSPGEPLLVIQNNYELQRFNGEVIRFDGWDYIGPERDVADPWTHEAYKTAFGRAVVEGDQVLMAVKQLYGHLETYSKKHLEEAAKRYVTSEKEGIFLHANFGYALSCHKAQGSEWDRVLVVLEKSINLSSYEGLRWAYTGVTRAAKEVSICYQPELLDVIKR